MDYRIVIGAAAVTFAVGKTIKDMIAERKLRREVEMILIQEELREELLAIHNAEMIVRKRIREGRYQTVDQVTTDLRFETIIQRDF